MKLISLDTEQKIKAISAHFASKVALIFIHYIKYLQVFVIMQNRFIHTLINLQIIQQILL